MVTALRGKNEPYALFSWYLWRGDADWKSVANILACVPMLMLARVFPRMAGEKVVQSQVCRLGCSLDEMNEDFCIVQPLLAADG